MEDCDMPSCRCHLLFAENNAAQNELQHADTQLARSLQGIHCKSWLKLLLCIQIVVLQQKPEQAALT